MMSTNLYANDSDAWAPPREGFPRARPARAAALPLASPPPLGRQENGGRCRREPGGPRKKDIRRMFFTVHLQATGTGAAIIYLVPGTWYQGLRSFCSGTHLVDAPCQRLSKRSVATRHTTLVDLPRCWAEGYTTTLESYKVCTRGKQATSELGVELGVGRTVWKPQKMFSPQGDRGKQQV